MSKVLLALTYLAIALAYAAQAEAKPVECANSSGQIRYEGTETVVSNENKLEYKYDGNFILAAARSERNYVIGDLFRETSEMGIQNNFVVNANLLVVDGTPCTQSSNSACTQVDRTTTEMLCSYIQN